MLVAAIEVAHDPLAAVAHHRATHSPRSGDPQPDRPVVAAIAHPKQEPPAINPAPGLPRSREIGAAVDALRRTEEKAALRGVRQR